ncbi:hypothetical protein BH11MYX3_BH11MYX3_26750 [soil metagenome]
MGAQREIHRQRERGSAALFVIGAVALSVAAGIGVYGVSKQQREAISADPATAIDDEPKPAPPRERTDPLDPAPSPPITETPPEPPATADADGSDEASSRPRPPGDGVCDEVGCVLNNYEGACCAKFRRPAAPDSASAPDSPSRDELRTALGVLRSKVVACANAQELTGTFKVRFKVAPSGMVSEVSIADAEPPFSACVARAFKSYKFSASRNGVTASFPFTVQ